MSVLVGTHRVLAAVAVIDAALAEDLAERDAARDPAAWLAAHVGEDLEARLLNARRPTPPAGPS